MTNKPAWWTPRRIGWLVLTGGTVTAVLALLAWLLLPNTPLLAAAYIMVLAGLEAFLGGSLLRQFPSPRSPQVRS